MRFATKRVDSFEAAGLGTVGTPLELDTDGVWTLLPATFPENFEFTGTYVAHSAAVCVGYVPSLTLNLCQRCTQELRLLVSVHNAERSSREAL